MIELKLWRGSPERPWPETGMTTQRWMDEVNPRPVPIADLVLVQDTLDLQALVTGAASESGDPYPHVIAFGGQLWLEDGHHRVVRMALLGATHVEARVHEP